MRTRFLLITTIILFLYSSFGNAESISLSIATTDYSRFLAPNKEDELSELTLMDTVKDVSYGPIQLTDTIWTLAAKMRKDSSVSVAQVALTLYLLNPDSFQDLNIYQLKPNSYLIVPTLWQVQKTTKDKAMQQLKSDLGRIEKKREDDNSTIPERANMNQEVIEQQITVNSIKQDIDQNITQDLNQEINRSQIESKETKQISLFKLNELQEKLEISKRAQYLIRQNAILTEENQNLFNLVKELEKSQMRSFLTIVIFLLITIITLAYNILRGFKEKLSTRNKVQNRTEASNKSDALIKPENEPLIQELYITNSAQVKKQHFVFSSGLNRILAIILGKGTQR